MNMPLLQISKQLIRATLFAFLPCSLSLFQLGAVEPLDADVQTQIRQLIEHLGDRNFTERELAATRLRQIGEAARDLLEEARAHSKDEEVRARAKEILMQLDRDQLSASEMHVVGLYQARHSFRLIDPFGAGVSWTRFCEKLLDESKAAQPSPGKRIWELLDVDSRKIVSDVEQVRLVAEFAEDIRRKKEGERKIKRATDGSNSFDRLRNSLELALRNSTFYKPDYFESVTLQGEGKKLLQRVDALSTLERWVLNRRLFEASYPELVTPMDYNLDDAAIRIRVDATPQPINLVLCANGPIHWMIEASEGAKIKNVIVGGYYPQLVTGTKAKIHSFIYQNETGQGNNSFFYANKQDSREYEHMCQRLRELTDAEITSFQHAHSSEESSRFRVPATEK